MYIHPYYFIVFDHVIIHLNVEILFVSACTLTTFVFSENRSSVHATDSSRTNPHKTNGRMLHVQLEVAVQSELEEAGNQVEGTRTGNYCWGYRTK